VNALAMSADAKWAVTGSSDAMLRLWEIEWEWEMKKTSPQDDGVFPLLENFLYLHTPPVNVTLHPDREPLEGEKPELLRRRGKASWSEDDFEELKEMLQNTGYGWLTVGGVREMLRQLAPQVEESLELPPAPEGQEEPAPEEKQNLEAPARGPEQAEPVKDDRKPWFSKIAGLFKKP